MRMVATSAVSFALGATAAYAANRYPGHREIIDAVGAVFVIGWALLLSLFIGRGSGGRGRCERNRPGTAGVMRGTAAPPGHC